MDKLSFLSGIYFNEVQYLSNKAAALNVENFNGHSDWNVDSVAEAITAAGLTSLEHYTKYGAFETNAKGGLGINPGWWFDQDSYYTDKVEQLQGVGINMSKTEVAEAIWSAGLTPLSHYSAYGYSEWVFPTLDSMHNVEFTNPSFLNFPSTDYRINSLAHMTIDWVSPNALGVKQGNVLYYAYPTDPKAQLASPEVDTLVNVEGFTPLQKEGTETALDMLSGVTGIKFVQTQNTAQANLVFFSGTAPDMEGEALAYSQWIDEDTNTIVMNTGDFPILNDLRFGSKNEEFMTVLHEVGHALGLKHPFDSESGPVALQGNEDNYVYTLMSYNNSNINAGEENAWYLETAGDNFLSPYDIAALQWLYGTDGLNGSEGFVYTGA